MKADTDKIKILPRNPLINAQLLHSSTSFFHVPVYPLAEDMVLDPSQQIKRVNLAAEKPSSLISS